MEIDTIVLQNNKCSVIIQHAVLNKMIKYIQCKLHTPESGGILVGWVFDGKIEVTDCSVPGKYDKQSRYRFLRSRKSAQSFIDIKFVASQGKEVYLGEWHTHPENSPYPSKLDITDFEKSMRLSVLNSSYLLMTIVGIKGIYFRTYHQNKFLFEKNLSFLFDK